MNICLLTPTFLPKLGGVEIIVSSLARQYVRAGHRVIVVTQWPRKGRGEPQDEGLGYPVIRYSRPISFLWLRSIAKALTQAHKQLPFEVIHCHLAYPTGPVALSVGRKLGLPVVITTHGSDIRADSRYRQRCLIWRSLCRSLREADALTAISEEMKTLLTQIVGQNGKKLCLIPNAVDIEELNLPVRHDPAWTLDPEKPFFLYLGGLSHKKGVGSLLEAVNILKEKGQSAAHLIVAGDGADRGKLEQFTWTHGLNDRVQFVGKVSGDFKNYLFQNCRFVVMPSVTEGFGLVAIEAFSCGKPLVASAVGGLKELMGNNETLGRLVPPENPAALAQALTDMESSLGNYQPEAIRQFAKKYDWTTVAQAYLNLYRTVGKKS
jgi:glycosyltransferase involved in cell wall biosynthesis